MNGYVYVSNGMVCVETRDARGDVVRDLWTEDAARTHAREILTTADECEKQRRSVMDSCADGHDWGEPYDGWLPWPNCNITIRLCQRGGCRETLTLNSRGVKREVSIDDDPKTILENILKASREAISDGYEVILFRMPLSTLQRLAVYRNLSPNDVLAAGMFGRPIVIDNTLTTIVADLRG